MSIRSALCGALVGAAMSTSAVAGLVGDTVTVTNYFNGSLFQGPSNVSVVDPGVEFTNFGDIWNIDIGDTTIRMTSTASGILGGLDEYIFSDLDWLPTAASILGVGVSTAGTATANVSFTADSVTVRFPNGSTVSEADILLTLRVDDGGGNVPEPGILGLLGLGLAAFAGRRRIR